MTNWFLFGCAILSLFPLLQTPLHQRHQHLFCQGRAVQQHLSPLNTCHGHPSLSLSQHPANRISVHQPNEATTQAIISTCGFFLLASLRLVGVFSILLQFLTQPSCLSSPHPTLFFLPVSCFLLAGGAAFSPGSSGGVWRHVC